MIQPECEEHRLTYEDYMDFPNDGKRYEIVEGGLHVTPTPSVDQHQTVLVRLLLFLANHLASSGLGAVWPAPVDVLLSPYDVVQPDIIFVSKERMDIVKREIAGPPDLTVEITSPSTARMDRVTKKKLYAAHAVRYYWVVDPRARRVEEYKLAGSVYRLRTRLEGATTFKPALFPNLEIPLGQVWAEKRLRNAKPNVAGD